MISQKKIAEARALLGIKEEATVGEIKKAYRLKALQFHPDHNATRDTTLEMQAINNAYEILFKTDNGRKTNDEDIADQDLESFFRFYKFFFETKQPHASDTVSEESFQQTLRKIKDNLQEREGFVYAGYKSLFGINVQQVQRLLIHSIHYGGNNFNLEGHAFRPEVLVYLLHFLADYKAPDNTRCKLDLSDNLFEHPEAIEALIYFLQNAQSQWELILNKCKLNLDLEMARCFKESTVLYGLSLKENELSERHALALQDIIKENACLESIDFSENIFSNNTLLFITQGISKSQSLQKIAFSIFERNGHETLPSSLLLSCLNNPFKLSEVNITYTGSKSDKFYWAAPLHGVAKENPRIETLIFSGFHIQPDTIQSILSSKFTGLKKLALRGCRLFDETLQAIANVINFSPLKHLAIESPIGLYTGQAAIFNALSENTSLTRLELYHYSMFSETGPEKTYQPSVEQALEKLVRCNTTLLALEIQACNPLSPDAAIELSKTFKDFNHTLTTLKMNGHYNQIVQSIFRNEMEFIVRQPPVIEAQKTAKEIDYSQEEFCFLKGEIYELIASGGNTFKFKQYKNDGRIIKGHFCRYRDEYVSRGQLEELLNLMVTGNFSRIDLSHERYLPPTYQGLILQKLRQYYENFDSTKLLALNLSDNNLSGQIKELIGLIANPHLETLNLSDIVLLPGELSLLADAIAIHPTLREVSLPGTEYDSEFDTREISRVATPALARMLTRNQILQVFNLSDRGMKDKELLPLLRVLTRSAKSGIRLFGSRSHAANNSTINSLSLEIHDTDVDKELAKVLMTNASLKKFTLKLKSCVYSKSVRAALCSPWLEELFIRSGFMSKVFEKEQKANSKSKPSSLAVVSLIDCQVDNLTLAQLHALPLRKLDLSSNRLYADIHGPALIALIQAKASTLEEINLSDNFLHSISANKNESHFLGELSPVLSCCKRLKVLSLEGSNFNLVDTIKCIRRLKQNNKNLTFIAINLPTKFFSSTRFIDKEIAQYTAFLVQEMSLKNQLLANNQANILTSLKALYKDEIDRLVKNIADIIDKKLHGDVFERLLGKKQDLKPVWTKEHQQLIHLIKAGKYGQFHQQWNNWKKTQGDTENNIDIHPSIMFDWIDECLGLYANSIKKHSEKQAKWVTAFKEPEIIFPAYEDKLELLENDRLHEDQMREKKWADEREQRQKSDTSIC